MGAKKFNVYVINIENFKATENAGENINIENVNTQVSAVERRINLLDYFVQAYEVGSERDLECKKDLK